MTNVPLLENTPSKKPILRKKYFPISRDSLDLDEEVLNWLSEAKSKTDLVVRPLHAAMLQSCIDAVAANPKLGSRINELFSDMIDRNVNVLLYTGKYQVEGFDAPFFYKLKKRENRGFKKIVNNWSRHCEKKKS